MNQSSYTKLFQMDKDVQCQKCKVKFTNRNQKKRHMWNPMGKRLGLNLVIYL